MRVTTKAPCSKHTDCFANIKGHCACLRNNDFGERECPFYKNNMTAAAERENAKQRLLKMGRTDLIETYHRRKINA